MTQRSGILFVICLTFLFSCGPAPDPQEEQGLAEWGRLVRAQTTVLAQQSVVLRQRASSDVEAAREQWLNVADAYHSLEGMGGGVKRFTPLMLNIGMGLSPETEISETGTPGREAPDQNAKNNGSKDQVATAVLLGDGTTMVLPGNLLHAGTESMLWKRGTWAREYDPGVLIAAMEALEKQTGDLRDSARTWKPSRGDAFATVDSALAYLGYRIFQWSESKKPENQTSEPNESFPAQSRLVGLRLSLETAQRVYRMTFRYSIDSSQVEMLDSDFRTILQFVRKLENDDRKDVTQTEEQRNVLIDQAAALSEQALTHLDHVARSLSISYSGTGPEGRG